MKITRCSMIHCQTVRPTRMLILLIVGAGLLLTGSVKGNPRHAWDYEDRIEKEYESAARELESWFTGAFKKTTELENDTTTPVLGIKFTDLDVKQVYEMNYPFNYGVLVTRTSPTLTGLAVFPDDILLNLDDDRILYADHLQKLIKSRQIGESVRISYYRAGKIYTGQTTLTPRNEADEMFIPRKRQPFRQTRGFGGGGYRLQAIANDPAPLNSILSNLSLGDAPAYLLLHGADIEFLVGNGMFCGLQGNWGGFSRNGTITVNSIPIDRTAYYRAATYTVSLEKRWRPGDRWLLSTGMQFGLGRNYLDIYQTPTNQNLTWDDIDSSGAVSNFLALKQKLLVYQPSITLSYRVAPVFWLKLEAGYQGSFAAQNWYNVTEKDAFTLAGQKQSLNGWSVSISPWFGF